MYFFYNQTVFIICVILLTIHETASTFSIKKFVECGRYGFTCEGSNKLRLCDEDRLFGPTFNCPANSICNEESSDVCENSINYVDPLLSRTLRCHRYERIADPSVPHCRGYILCIPNSNRFQGIKFKCTGNTIFNGFTRTCSTPDKYKCPLYDSQTTSTKHIDGHNYKTDLYKAPGVDRTSSSQRNRPIDCKSYKFVVTQEKSPVGAMYFCPPRPVNGEPKVRCTVFSNQFCITLERDDADQFVERAGMAYRKPRFIDPLDVYL